MVRYPLDRAAPENSLSIELVFFGFVVSIDAKMLWNRLLLNPDSNPMGFKEEANIIKILDQDQQYSKTYDFQAINLLFYCMD